jgi:hypothetical protein
MLSLNDYDDIKAGRIKEPAWMAPFHVNWPEESRGSWHIRRFTVEMDLPLLRLMRDGRGTLPGRYTMLRHDSRGVVMSDTMAEIGDHREVYRRARGRVLLHGLGLGCILQAVLSKESVAHVDVVEIDPDVIALVGRHFAGDPRVTIHHGDCLTHRWPKQARWDAVWHDIWDNICEDNLPQMRLLMRRFRSRCGWQGCWSRGLIP